MIPGPMISSGEALNPAIFIRLSCFPSNVCTRFNDIIQKLSIVSTKYVFFVRNNHGRRTLVHTKEIVKAYLRVFVVNKQCVWILDSWCMFVRNDVLIYVVYVYFTVWFCILSPVHRSSRSMFMLFLLFCVLCVSHYNVHLLFRWWHGLDLF